MTRHAYDSPERTLYRSRKGMFCGVLQGISNHYDYNVTWVRVGFIVLMFCTGITPLAIAYFVAMLIMKDEPVMPLESADDEEFYHAYTTSRSMALERLKRTYNNLDRRIQRIENAVTTRDFDWDERLNQ
jgi:phage shock protein C